MECGILIAASRVAAFRQDVEHRRDSARVNYVFGHPLDVRRRDVQEDVDFAVGGRDVVVDDRGMRQVKRLLLRRSRGRRCSRA